MSAGDEIKGDGLSPETVLERLSDAANEQLHWFEAWHRSVVCKLPPSEQVIAGGSGDDSEFLTWLSDHRQDPLIDQPAFRELEKRLSELHEFGGRLARRAYRDSQVPVADYDAFTARMNGFNEQLQRLERAFRHARSDLDPLTGLYNRQALGRILDRERQRSARTGQPIALALADLDHFKTINDTHGHAAGDQVLAFAAGLFVSGVRPYDMIFRYGGEEFLFCLPGAGLEQAAMILERLHKRLATSSIRLRSGERIKVTTSIGVAELCDGETPEDALERADKALYRAKQNGRNRIEVDDGSA